MIACKRSATALVAISLLVIPSSQAENAAPAADQPVSWKERGSATVAGTTWAGYSHGEYFEFHFRPDGSLHYKSPTGSWDRATWKQSKNKVYMEMNNRYSEYEGTITGKSMTGRAWNVTGLKWTWAADRK
jgi:hypothetical protein